MNANDNLSSNWQNADHASDVEVSLLHFAPEPKVRVKTYGRVVVGASLTLTLSILGSSVLPVPFAFSRMGVLVGMLMCLVVAAANSLTAQLLLNAAGELKHNSYEGLAEAIGGKGAKVVTQFSLTLLLFGTLTGDFALLADVGSESLTKLFAEAAPEWLVGHGGRGIMVVLVIAVCTPLMMLKHMTSLEYAAMFGLVPLAVFLVIMVVDTIMAGFPAIASGEFPLWEVKLSGDLPEAIAVLGYAFYMQPMLLPLLHEMPAGQLGLKALSNGVRISVMGVATSVYSVAGIFGAARWGAETKGDCLMNDWVNSKWGGLLNLSMTAYLACSAVPVLMSLRYTLECMVAGEDAPFLLRRHVALTLPPLGLALGLALAYPTYSEKIFAVTGALPVCLICYIIPVWLHMQLYYRRSSGRMAAMKANPTVPPGVAASHLIEPLVPPCHPTGNIGPPFGPSWMSFFNNVAAPLFVAVLMTVISALAFWTSIKAFVHGDDSPAGNRLVHSWWY